LIFGGPVPPSPEMIVLQDEPSEVFAILCLTIKHRV
jgi:hypothetical protein